MMSTPVSSSMASTSRLPPSTSKVPAPSTSSLGIRFSSPGRRPSGCHTLKIPANVRARGRTAHAWEGAPEVLAGPLRGTLPYHQCAGSSENFGREGELTDAESAQDRDGGAGKAGADRDG